MAHAEHSVVEAAGRFLKNFKRPVHLLVAISGGSDSTGLLVALAMLCATGRYPGVSLSACTVDHDLRPGSAEEAEWVRMLCMRYGVPHVTRRWQGEKPATGLQAAARAKRYDLLADAAVAAGAHAILAAHTRDDQAETVAMRANRSAEGVGLSGMADAVLLDGSVWLLRPFLAMGRAAIRTFLTEKGERWLEDPSNDNPRFERVRIRERGMSPEPEQASGDRSTLSQRAAEFLAGNIRAENAFFVLEPAAIGTALDDKAAWRGLLLLTATAGGRVHVLETASAARLHGFLASGTLSRLTAGRVVFDRRRDGLFLYREHRGIESLTLPAGKGGIWDGRYRITNKAARTISVSAGRSGEGVPLRGPALRASRAAPRLAFEGGEAVPVAVAMIAPLIAPYARFLPRFDLLVANALAGILQLPPFPSPPNE